MQGAVVRSPNTFFIFLFLLSVTVAPSTAQHVCDGPPTLTVLTGQPLEASGAASDGHPVGFRWFVTPPGEPTPLFPTATGVTLDLVPDSPGIWSVALVVDYEHYHLGGPWSSEACLTVKAASVVASIALDTAQIATDEELDVNGYGSEWAVGATPEVEWQVDGQPLGSCNGGPPPSIPADLECTIPANWLPPGWHTAGLLLTDPSSGQTSLDTADFEVIEVVPLSVDFGWTPSEPDPGELVHFQGIATPSMPEEDFTRVTWDLGDGTVQVYDSCPPFFGSCLEWPHTYATDGWYDVSVTVETIDETASKTHAVKIGDPVAPPVASFTATPSSPLILEQTTLSFTGSCTGDCTWLWDFGDGAQSTLENPIHQWEVPTSYPVTVTVGNQSGNDQASVGINVSSCWSPTAPIQDGSCYGGQVFLTAAAGSAWSWSTGHTTQTIGAPIAGAYWVNINDGAGCWGHSPVTVVLDNCGDEGGDTNLDGVVDAADVAAMIPELTDGDGDTVVGAGGGDLTAPGGDVSGDFRLRVDDLLLVLVELYR
jgi:PKD repeat protein